MVCVLKASDVKRWLAGSWFLGPLAGLGTAIPLSPPGAREAAVTGTDASA